MLVSSGSAIQCGEGRLNPADSLIHHPLRRHGGGRPSSCRKRSHSNSRPRLAFHDLVVGFWGLPGDLPVPIRDRRNTRCTIYATLVHHNALSCCYNCIYFSSVEFRHHIVTGFDLHPDATCRVRRRHLPLFSNRIQKFGTSVNNRRPSEPATTMIGSPLCDRCSSVVARVAEEVLQHLTTLPGGKVRGVKWLRIVRNRSDFIRVEPFCKEVGDRDGEASAQSREFLLVEPDWCVRAGAYQTEHSCKTMLLLLGNEARGS